MTPHPALVDFIRTERYNLFAPGAPMHILSLVGLDDKTLSRWENSSDCVVTLPHASPNVFYPRTRVCQFASRIQKNASSTHHVRAVLTHINFSDLGWRPYAWWYLDHSQIIRTHRFFSRNKRRKHTVVNSRPAMQEVPTGLIGVDADAASAALWGGDLSISFLLIGAVIERAAGIAPAGRVTYFPLSLLVRFAQRESVGSGDLAAWCASLLNQAEGRRIGVDGLLESADAHQADVLDNASNQALLALLGGPSLLGGRKMLNYWGTVDTVLENLISHAPPDFLPPRMQLVPEYDLLESFRPSEAVKAQLGKLGIPYSQGLAVAEHGDFADRLTGDVISRELEAGIREAE